jgi:hypothetical protein
MNESKPAALTDDGKQIARVLLRGLKMIVGCLEALLGNKKPRN